MTETKEPVQVPQAESLEPETDTNKSLAEIEKDKRRISHSEDTIDSAAVLRDRSFERLLIIGGIVFIAILIGALIFLYRAVESGVVNEGVTVVEEDLDLTTQIKPADTYNFSYSLSSGSFTYDPLLNTSTPTNSSVQSSSNSSGGYRIGGGENSTIISPTGETVFIFSDSSIIINSLIITPDKSAVVFDVRPRDTGDGGLRMGIYELDTQSNEVEVLISDFSPGSADPEYQASLIRLVSISDDSRYIAYTNRSTLKIYDRTSSGSIDVAELDSASQIPTTTWTLRE